MKNLYGLKKKIILYVMSVSILIAVLIVCIMSFSGVHTTNAILLDNMQITARIASQSISSNLHLLTERMYNLSQDRLLTMDSANDAAKNEKLGQARQEIEFVWLAAYDVNGSKLYGDEQSPDSVAEHDCYAHLTQTSNSVIGEPYYENNLPQICVGAPLKNKQDTIIGYLIGSYKYDLLNDVLSMLILGDTGSACIVNENGTIVGDRNLSNVIEQKNIYDLYTSSKNKALFDKALSFQTGSGSVRLGHTKNYIGYAPIPGTNWALMVYAPQWEFMNSTFLSILLCGLLSAIALAAAASVILPLSNKISDSLSSVTRHLQALADGNLSEEVTLSHNNDETDVLTAALAKTIARLNEYIQNIRSCLGALASGDYTVAIPDNFDGDFSSIQDSLSNIADSLNQNMRQMNHSSQEINQNSSEVSDYARQLHDGSLEQSDLLLHLEESMQAITDSIKHNRENVSQIEQCSENANEKTSLGAAHMQSMLDTMNEIHNSVEEISKISQLIESISNQTNLLSLNASIEAARAGEAGRGFAVVASEIGQLSTQTTDALHQTGTIIVHATDVIQKGLLTANETSDAFHEIETVSAQYHAISQKLAATAEEQENAVSYVNGQLSSLNDIAAANRTLAEETDKMAAASLAQSADLKNYVAQVKIKECL